jgi:hypothetical protein
MAVRAVQGGAGRVRTGRISTGTGAASGTWFVDSVAGSDSNNGTASGTPFATLAKVATSITANPTKTNVALKRGSLFRESLPTTATSVSDYGSTSDPVPIIAGDDVITGWTVNGTQAAVWEKTVTIDAGGRPRIYEDGLIMPSVADLATCASTAGSRVLLNDGGTVLLQMHPTGGGNPNTNGKTYEATVRLAPVVMGDNCFLIGVHARRGVSNNGAIKMGRGAYVERCLAVDGSKHNALIGSGTVVDSIAFRADAPTAAEPSNALWVGYDDRGIPGQSLTLRRVGVIADSIAAGGSALITHDNSGGAYDTVTAEQVWMVKTGSFGPSTGILTVRGYYAEQCFFPIGGWYSSQVSFDCFQTKNTGLTSDVGMINFTAAPLLTPQSVTLSDGAAYSEGSTDAILRLQAVMNGVNLTLRNVALTTSLGVSRIAISGEGWSSGTMTLQGNVFHTSPSGTSINAPTGITYTGDDNLFAKQDGAGAGAGTESLIYHGTTYGGLAAWKTATSQDANSLEFEGQNIGQLFNSYAAGDFTLKGTGIGALAAGIGAGLQNHWDWNTRAKVSGSSTYWPKVPKTLAEIIAYVGNPTAWGWTAAATGPVYQTSFLTASSLPAEFSLSRATAGTYFNSSGVLTTAAINAARFDRVRTTPFAARGLLVEAQHANAIQNSQNAMSYITVDTTVALSGTNGLDGTADICVLTASATTNAHLLYNLFNSGFSVPRSVTFYADVKYTNNQWIALGVYDGAWRGMNFDVQNGVVGGGDTGVTGKIEAAANGWWRCSITMTSAAASMYVAFFLSPGTSYTIWGTWAAAGTETVLFGELQLEDNSFASSFVLTGAAVGTRSADLLSSNSPLTGYLTAGPSVWEFEDEATGTISRSAYAAGAFDWPVDKWYRSMAVYPTGTDTSGHLTVGSAY